jgi:hypothetical protein
LVSFHHLAPTIRDASINLKLTPGEADVLLENAENKEELLVNFEEFSAMVSRFLIWLITFILDM